MVEEIEFDADGKLWAVFEAGAIKFTGWKYPNFFPVVPRSTPRYSPKRQVLLASRCDTFLTGRV